MQEGTDLDGLQLLRDSPGLEGDDPTRLLQEVLQGRGSVLEPARPVAGDLDFSQAWSRAVVWAAEIE